MLKKKCSEFKSMNDFFSRGMANDRRPNLIGPNGTSKVAIAEDGSAPLISAADSRVMVYNTIDAATRFWVKEKKFRLGIFLGTESRQCDKCQGSGSQRRGLWFAFARPLTNCTACGGPGIDKDSVQAQKYTNELLSGDPETEVSESEEGEKKKPSMVIFRLAPQDYHRFHYAVSGRVIDHYAIKGDLLSVNPGAVNNEDFKVFQENQRYVTVIETDNGQKVFAVAVGAAMVGSIVFEEDNGKSCVEIGTVITAGQTHGKMRYGGSTVVYVYEEGVVEYDPELLKRCKGKWTKDGEEWPMMETYYQVSEKLGNSKYRAAPSA